MLNQAIRLGYAHETTSIKETFQTVAAEYEFGKGNLALLSKCFEDDEFYQAANYNFTERLEEAKELRHTDFNLFHDLVYINEKYKKNKGLVYTPPELVLEIINRLPLTNKENPTIIVVNALSGSFPIVLKERFPSARIICVEYFSHNIQYLRRIGFEVVDLEQNVNNLNIGYITIRIKDLPMKFDLVIGNPPYNYEVVPGGKKTTTNPLWYSFVGCSLLIVQRSGIVALVTPNTWVQQNNTIHKTLKSNNLIAAKVYSKSKSPFGNIGTTASYWIVKKQQPSGSFIVSFDDNEVDVSNVNFIPIEADDIGLRMGILSKTLNSNCLKFQVIISDKHYSNQKKDYVRSQQTEIYQYPVYNTHETPRMWSRFKDSLHGTPKVILPYTGTVNRAVYDLERSGTERAIMFRVNNEEEGAILIDVLRTKLFRFLLASCKTNATIPRDVFRSLPLVDISRTWTKSQLYEHFKLSVDEINLIES
jgi:hypothetical protein